VNREDRGSFLLVRQGDLDVAGEPPRGKERRGEDPGANPYRELPSVDDALRAPALLSE